MYKLEFHQLYKLFLFIKAICFDFVYNITVFYSFALYL